MSGRVYVRKFDWDEARARHGAGESITDIARDLGVTWAAVQRVVVPGQIERQAEYARALAKTGRCDDCGGPMNRISRYRGARRCMTCSAIAQGTTARKGELQCVTCHEWKPDGEFAHDHRRIARRGRHRQCRGCNTEARREYRQRNRERERAYDRAYKARRRAQAGAEDPASLKEAGDH